MPGADGPLVNEYKIDFIKKRLLQTLFGGPKCLCGQKISLCVHFSQFAIHVFPFVISGTILAFTETNTITLLHGMCCVGSLMFVYTLLVQCCSWRLQKRATTVAPVKSKTVDLISKEDVSLHDSSCCSAKVIEIIIPLKRYKLNLFFHAFISGSMYAGIFHYLAPSSLQILFENKTVIYVLLICGWLVTCVAQYSLSTSSPPEPVVYHALDTFEIASLMRPFYVLLFILLHMIAWHYSWLLYVDQYLHIAFVFLPLLWFMGILPPLDALFPWLGEQVLVYILGGSAMASDCRLIVMLILSVTNVVVLFCIPSTSVCIILAAFSGYILSLDLNRCWNFFLNLFSKNESREKYVSKSDDVLFKSCKMESEFITVVVFYISVFILLGIIVILCHFKTNYKEDDKYICDILGYILLFLLILNKAFCSLQQVYMLGNIFINPFHPPDTSQRTVYIRQKRQLELLGYIRLFFINVGSPLIMASYLCIIISKSTDNSSNILNKSKFIWIIIIVRAFRWIWQQTENSLSEMVVIHFMDHFFPSLFQLGFFEQFLLIAVIHSRIVEFYQKLQFAFILLISSVTLKKQRVRCSFVIATLNILFLPVLIAIIFLSSIIASPLLPLFTLPIFIIGFPRPIKIWPNQGKKNVINAGDAVFYKQITPILMSNFQRSHILGSLGTVNVGNYFLIRFEDRVALLSILEKGFGFCTLSIKGLELQETSCHTVEATYLDSILSNAFERDKKNCNKKCLCLNPYPFHIYNPLTAIFLVTYSDTRNVLTALIDSPDTLQLIALSFLKSLVWVLVHHCARKHLSETKEKELQKTTSDHHLDEVWPLSTHPRTKSAETIKRLPKAKRVEECVADIAWYPSKSPVILENGPLPSVNSPNHLSSTWSDDDDDDPLGENPLFSANNKIPSVTSSRPATNIRTVFIPHIPGSVGDSSLQEAEFGFPAVDINITEKGDVKPNRLTIIQNSIKYSAASSKLSPPMQWLELPFDDLLLNKFFTEFPVKWYYFVVNLVATKILHFDENVTSEMESDKILMKVFQKIVLACYVIINHLHSKPDNQIHLKPGHVYKTFIGDIPWSSFLEWLINKEDLFHLVLKAYGYATKFALDQVLLGEVSEDQEIADYFTEYDDNWYIGNDANVKWGENILQNKPNLFSLGYNPIQRTFTSHLLTLQSMPVCIGSLNPEAVRGLWSSLTYELFYLTNDDEERYSIQAHPYLFRNLIIQSADSPLGYPLYSSEPLSCGFESIIKFKK